MIIAEDAIPEIVLELDFVKIGLVLWIKECRRRDGKAGREGK